MKQPPSDPVPTLKGDGAPKKIKYTAPVRRGFGQIGIVLDLVLSHAASAASIEQTLSKWTTPQRKDFESSLKWLNQEAQET